MHIVVISTASLRTPPEAYGGIEMQAWLQVKGLSELGHRVDLIAKAGSFIPPNGNLYAYEGDRELHEIIDRIIVEPVDCFIDETHDKVLSTQYPDLAQITRYEVMSLMGSPHCPVLISKGQRDEKFNGANWPIIYQSIDLSQLPLYIGRRDKYLLYMGQKITEKRIDWACEVAARAELPLFIHGPGWGQPECHNLIGGYQALYPEFIHNEGEIGGSEKIQKMQRAKALIHLPGALNWCEAGGIVVLEALAMGTPCIVSRNGCLPEYIENGRNGFVVDSIQEAVYALTQVDRIDPLVCSQSVEKFDYRQQAKQYEDLCRRAAQGERWR
jgi:glycosyltransferase involved in cell wall biosynthesis